MGIIKKQSIQGTILLYIGVFIGFITTAVLFPRILKEEEIGLINTLLAYSIVFAQFGTLGFNSVITKFFAYFRNSETKHNNFFFFVFAIIVIGSVISIAIFYFFRSTIIEQNIKNSPLFVEYIDYLGPLVFFSLVFFLLDNYYTLLFKSVRGIFLKELVQRVIILGILVFYYLEIICQKNFFNLYVIAVCLPSIILIITLIFEGEFVIKPKLNFISRTVGQSMLSVSVFGILASLVGSANMQIDKAMTSSMIGLGATGIYSTVSVFALFIKVPSRAMLKIASAIIAEAWKRNDLEEIKTVYVKTSFNQYLIALLVFVGLLTNIDNIFNVLGENYLQGKYVILILGFAYTFEMATGAANNIIGTSKYYKYLTWFVALMLIIAVLSNLIFIPIFSVAGVALATGITTITFTLMKLIFIYRRFKIQPFSLRFLLVTFIGVFVYIISLIIPVFGNYILDILLRSSIVTILYVALVFLTGVSDDLNNIFKSLLNKYR